MIKLKKVKIALILVLLIISVFAVGIFTYILLSGGFSNLQVVAPPSAYERVSITNAYTNGTKNAVFLDVTSTTKKFNFSSTITDAIFKDTNGKSMASEELSVLLLKGESTTLRVNCTLPSGNYTIALVTGAGGMFLSPSFFVP